MLKEVFPLASSSSASPKLLADAYLRSTKKHLNIEKADIWSNLLWRNHSTSCIPIQVQIPEKVDLLEFQLLFSLLYLLVWTSAIIGNFLVIYIVNLKQVKISSVRSVFICNLAMSDILMSLTSLPITAISIFTRDWVFPSFFCNLMGVFQGGSVFVSSFTLSAIAVDRYILVKHPADEKIGMKKALLIIILIWTFGYLFAFPVGIFNATEAYRPFCGYFCDEFWPDQNDVGISQLRKYYGTAVLIIQFGLPAIICIVCYWTIGRIIKNQIAKRKQHQLVLEENNNRLMNRKNRSNRMMLSMVMGLVLAWLPMNLINLWRDFDNSEKSSPWFSLIFALCHVSAMTSAVWNPIIYSWFNPQFKAILLRSIQDKRVQMRANSIGGISRRRSSSGGNIKRISLRKNDENIASILNTDTAQLMLNNSVNNGKCLSASQLE